MTENANPQRPGCADFETTGLDSREDAILEFAFVLLDRDLNTVADFGSRVLHATEEQLARMNDYVTVMHTENGLLDEVRASTLTLEALDQEIDAWLDEHGVPAAANPRDKGSILLGSSCRLDANIIEERMPLLSSRMTYRMMDVSGVRETIEMFAPGIMQYSSLTPVMYPELPAHRAHPDVLRTISEAQGIRSALRNVLPPF